jgi:hypothetical protein
MINHIETIVFPRFDTVQKLKVLHRNKFFHRDADTIEHKKALDMYLRCDSLMEQCIVVALMVVRELKSVFEA